MNFMNWIIDNKEWIFSGIGVFILTLIIGLFFKNKSKSSKLNLKSGNKSIKFQIGESDDNSTNVQISGNLVYNGITYLDAKQIALNVFNENFLKLSEKAANLALKRADELVDDFLNLIHDKNSNIIEKLQEPSIQYSLFNVQRAYAKSGDTYQKNQLLYLLIERVLSSEKTLHQIVLDEAIETLPKLSSEQLNFLTFHFILNDLTSLIRKKQSKFNPDPVPNPVYNISINEIINNLKHFFTISPPHIRQHIEGHLQYLGCFHEIEDDLGGLSHHIKRILESYCGFEVSDENIESILESIDRKFCCLYRLWTMRHKSNIKLTTVGLVISISHYNIQTNSHIEIFDFF